MKNFEDYLKDKHGSSYVGTDDMMPENYEAWLQDLSVDDWIIYAEDYAKIKTEGTK